ncbi:MAG: DUF177 domain-containing protein [Weeksellaceae bacterium]|nr:DUF177 domain-containing protein [Weeksellaceae bacterium]
MEKLRTYDIVFSSLKVGQHEFDFHIDQSFFDMFEIEQDFENPQVDVRVELDKKNTFMDFHFTSKGTVGLVCDVTNEPFTEKIKNRFDLKVKFGETFDDSDDEVWVIPQQDYKINVAQLIYELIMLSIPQKRVHPDLDEEQAKEAQDILDKYAPKFEDDKSDDDPNKTNDPRWDNLKKLL